MCNHDALLLLDQACPGEPYKITDVIATVKMYWTEYSKNLASPLSLAKAFNLVRIKERLPGIRQTVHVEVVAEVAVVLLPYLVAVGLWIKNGWRNLW